MHKPEAAEEQRPENTLAWCEPESAPGSMGNVTGMGHNSNNFRYSNTCASLYGCGNYQCIHVHMYVDSYIPIWAEVEIGRSGGGDGLLERE